MRPFWFTSLLALLPAAAPAQTLIFNSDMEATTAVGDFGGGSGACMEGLDGSVPPPNNWDTDLTAYGVCFDFNTVCNLTEKPAIIDDPTGAGQGKVLRYSFDDTSGCGGQGRNQAKLNYGSDTEFAIRIKMWLHPDFLIMVDRPVNTKYVIFLEHAQLGLGATRKFRIDAEIVTDGNGAPWRWRLHGNFNEDPRKFWQEFNTDVAVPFGEWFTSQIWIKVGDANTGRVKWEILRDGQQTPDVLFDVTNWTVNPENPDFSKIGRVDLVKLYIEKAAVDYMRANGGKFTVYWDEFKNWVGGYPGSIPPEGPPPTGTSLPKPDGGGKVSPYLRVVHRTTDTVETAYQAEALPLPATCSTTLTAGDTMTDLQNAINNTANQMICVAPGVDLGGGTATFTRNTNCGSPIVIGPSNYNDFDPDDWTQHPLNLTDSNRVNIGPIEVSGASDCPLLIYSVRIDDTLNPGISCTGVTGSEVHVSNSLVRGGIDLSVCGSKKHTVQYSRVTTGTPVALIDRNCIRLGANQGGTATGEGVWISENEIRNCAGAGVDFGTPGGRQNGGLKIWYNDFEATTAHKTDCDGNFVASEDSPCMAGNDAIVGGIGNVGDTLTPYVEIVGNRIRGWRAGDPTAGGKAGESTAVFDIYGDAAGVIVRDNVVWNSHHLIRSSSTASLAPQSGTRHSFMGNAVQLQPFNIDGTESFCAAQGGAVDCSVFNLGVRYDNMNLSRYAYNTMRWETGIGQSVTYLNATGDQQLLGNVWTRAGSPSGTFGSSAQIDCGAYESTSELADETAQYVGPIDLRPLSVFVDRLSNPREIALADLARLEGDADIGSLCSGVTANINGFGNSGNDGLQ